VTVALAFGEPASVAGGMTLRRATFHARSRLPLGTARTIAVGVGARLRALLGIDGDVELIEPCAIGDRQRRLLFGGAHVVRARGQHSDVYAVVRLADAGALVTRAFGERAGEAPAFSEIERGVLDRIVASVLPLCGSLCGALGPIGRVAADAALDCVTYFEVRTAAPAAIGFAFTRDPAPAGPAAGLRVEDLAAVRCDGRVEIARGRIGATALALLRVGAVIPLATRLDAPARFAVGDRVVCEGTAGECDGAAAFVAAGPAAA
jgi:Type III flagellar switch regulator (C-ring) FliN C-term